MSLLSDRHEPRLFHITAFFLTVSAVVFFLFIGQALARPLRIGVALPSSRESRWNLDLLALQAEADKNKIDILVRFAGNSQEQQNLQVREMINIGIDALLLAPDDVRAAAPAVAFAKSRHVPVISYDRLVQDCELDAYVTFEQENVGELMGRALVAAAPKGGYILISGASEDSNSALFKTGAMKYLQPLIDKGDIRVLADAEAMDWKESSAKFIVEEVLEKTTAITAVLAPNDDTARGVIAALAARHLAGKVFVTGQDCTADALERIYSGEQNMTIYKDTNRLARTAVGVITNIIQKTPVPTESFTNNGFKNVATYAIPVIPVTAKSLHWFLRLQETSN